MCLSCTNSAQLTAIQAVNILLRDYPLKHYTPMGARGRFFGLGKPTVIVTILTRQRAPSTSAAVR